MKSLRAKVKEIVKNKGDLYSLFPLDYKFLIQEGYCEIVVTIYNQDNKKIHKFRFDAED